MNAPHDTRHYPCVRFGCDALVPATAYVCDHHLTVDPPGDDEADEGEHLALTAGQSGTADDGEPLALNPATLNPEGQPHARSEAAA